ncbi:hypothetical protein GCM10027080_25540 [Pedococcus soli]
MGEPVDHRVRNTLAALRGYLELAREAARGEAGRPEDVVRDLSDSLASLTRLEHLLGVHADDGTADHGEGAHKDVEDVRDEG